MHRRVQSAQNSDNVPAHSMQIDILVQRQEARKADLSQHCNAVA